MKYRTTFSHSIISRILFCALACISLASSVSAAAPGEVLNFTKISSVTGGLVGPIEDFDNFGISADGLGDLDQDGIPDVAIGVDRDDDGAANAGAVYILFMNADGSVKAEQKISATAGGFSGVLDIDDRFGTRVASLGDLDGDGVTDLAVGARRDGDGGFRRGAVWILFLNTDGTVKSHQKISDISGGVTPALEDFANFSTPAAIGDLDGNGITELAVGAWGDTESGANAGAIWILFLLKDGTVHHTQKINAFNGGFGAVLAAGDRFGATIEGLGDLDGDGVPDIVVGADSDDDGGTDRGAVWILFLNSDGTVKSETKISSTQGGFNGLLENGDVLGLDIARLGDLNGDGVVDIAVGAGGDDDGGNGRGAVWILFLNSNGTVGGHNKISATSGGFGGALSDGDGFRGVAALGDLDGDGVTEIVGTALLDADGGPDRGAAYVLYLDGSSLVCGNGVLDPLEECDDGNISEFDGCTSFCEKEASLRIFGEATSAGQATTEIDGEPIAVSISSGDVPGLVAVEIAAEIDGNVSLGAFGTSARSNADTVYSNGGFASFLTTADGLSASIDPGTVLDEFKISTGQGGFSGAIGDQFGSGVGAAHDVDGDGRGDLIVGERFSDTGRAWILFLDDDHRVVSQQAIDGVAGGLGGVLDSGDRFGSSVAGVGDLDEDGVPDVAVGAVRDDDGGLTDSGAVWILFLNANGTVKSYEKISEAAPGFAGALSSFDGFGQSIAPLGDLDGDGVQDIAAGAWFGEDGDGDSSAGKIFVLFLNRNGTVKAYQPITELEGGFTGVLNSSDRFGISLANLGDVDGDGVIDLAVGANGDDDDPAMTGAVWILFMNNDGTVKSHRQVDRVSGGAWLTPMTNVGSEVVGLGDLDGDGTPELGVSGIEGDTSLRSFWINFLRPDGTIKRNRVISLEQGGFLGDYSPADFFATAATMIPSPPYDRGPTLAITAAGDSNGGTTPRGAVWILTIDGHPSMVCGDMFEVSPETCDDGNTSPGDGCYRNCQVEDEVVVTGIAQGGSLQVVVSGFAVFLSTEAGDSAEMVASDVAFAINSLSSLESAGISAVSIGGRVVSDGIFDSWVVSDPGISVPEPSFYWALTIGLAWLFGMAFRRSRLPLSLPRHTSGLFPNRDG